MTRIPGCANTKFPHRNLTCIPSRCITGPNIYFLLQGLDWTEQGLTSHQIHYRSYWGQAFMGQMT